MNKLGNLIRGIAGQYNKDPIQVKLCQVLTDAECSGEFNYLVGRTNTYSPENVSVAVKILTDNSSNDGDDISTIIPDVHLMCGIADGPITVPAQGSNIMVGFSIFNEPFILQYSEIAAYQSTSKDTKTNQLHLEANSASQKYSYVAQLDTDNSTFLKGSFKSYDSSPDKGLQEELIIDGNLVAGTAITGNNYSIITGTGTTKVTNPTPGEIKVTTDADHVDNITSQYIQTPLGFTFKNSGGGNLAYLMFDILNLLQQVQAPPGTAGGPLILLAPLTLESGGVIPAGPINLTQLSLNLNKIILP